MLNTNLLPRLTSGHLIGGALGAVIGYLLAWIIIPALTGALVFGELM